MEIVKRHMKLSVVLSTHAAQFEAVAFRGDFDANVARIAGYGYDGVELAIRDPRLVDIDQLERTIINHGLKVPAIGTGQAWGEEGLSFTDPDQRIRHAAIERIESHIPAASRFSAVIIIGLIRGVVRPGVDPAQAMDWLIAALKEICAAARVQGVRLALEPINRYETSLINTVSQGLELLEGVGADNLGLLLDTFHMNIEEADIGASILACGKHIFHFHVADSNRWYPGAGHLDFKSILSVLSSTGYSGYVSGEFIPQPDAETAAKQAINYLDKIF